MMEDCRIPATGSSPISQLSNSPAGFGAGALPKAAPRPQNDFFFPPLNATPDRFQTAALANWTSDKQAIHQAP